MRFRLGTILWGFALLAAALATFGLLIGLFATFTVLWIWLLVFKQSPFTFTQLLFTVAILGTLLGLFLPPSINRRDNLGQCKNSLKHLGKAIAQYDFENLGLPLNNWRTSLLPYLAENNTKSRALSGVAKTFYACPGDLNNTRNFTSYFSIVGPQCVWSDSGPAKLSDITDDPSQTILIPEAHNQNVAWTTSKDLSFDEAVQLLSDPAKQPQSCHWREGGFLEKPTWVRNVLFADGSVRSLNMPLPRKLAESLLTANGGEAIEPEELQRLSQPELNYRRIYSLSLFGVLSVLPIVHLRRRHRTAATEDRRAENSTSG